MVRNGEGLREKWVEIDLGAIEHNTKVVRDLVGAKVSVAAVVKADGYGHGAVQASRAALKGGAATLATASLREAEELRLAGIEAPILAMMPLLPEQAPLAVELKVTACVNSREAAASLDAAARNVRGVARVHVNVDTGMSRFGVTPARAPELLRQLARLRNIHVEGIFSHFATAGVRDVRATRQLDVFLRLLDKLEAEGIRPAIRHMANSLATVYMPEARLDMVRVGNLIYGEAVPETARRLGLKTTFTFRARVLEVRDLPTGVTIGYGREYRTSKPMRVAIIAAGWADGVATEPATQGGLRGVARRMVKDTYHWLRGTQVGQARVNGQWVRIVGRVGMESLALDVTAVHGIVPGDAVSLPVRRLYAGLSAPRVYAETAAQTE